MHWTQTATAAALATLFAVGSPAFPQASAIQPASSEPAATEHAYGTRGDVNLLAHVFAPEATPDGLAPSRPRAAVVVFHGGGWTLGEASWAFPIARHFSQMGAVGIAVQYRLSDEKSVTPLDAMADAREVIRWLRANAENLGIDPQRIAAYGWSAGGHLAACAAIFNDANDTNPPPEVSAPNALVLNSPAVSVSQPGGWFERLLLGRAEARAASPDEHVRAGLPPTLILQGDVDSVTPLAGAERFCRRMREAGNRCDLQVYEGFGHLFTPAGTPDDGWPQPDPTTRAAALQRVDDFLRDLGFLPASFRE
jgi:acetyl esterase/lipase